MLSILNVVFCELESIIRCAEPHTICTRIYVIGSVGKAAKRCAPTPGRQQPFAKRLVNNLNCSSISRATATAAAATVATAVATAATPATTATSQRR